MRILIAAGEVSGDRFGAGLACALKDRCPEFQLEAIGSDELAASGAELLLDLSHTSVIGLTEMIPGLLRSLRLLRRAKRILKERRPDLFIAVDCQGYNIKLAREAARLGIRVVYFIPPQNFFWGDVRLCRKIATLCDLIISIYRKGFDFYRSCGAKVFFAGHPLLDEVSDRKIEKSANGKQTVVLVPGTRKQELRRLLPVLLETARLLYKKDSNLHFLIPAAGERHETQLERAIAGIKLPCTVFKGSVSAALEGSALYLGKSGTASLEAALAGIPGVLVYRLSRISWFLLAHFAGLARKMRFIGLPNLLLDRSVMPEFLQGRVRPDLLAQEAGELLYNRDVGHVRAELSEEVRRILGEPGVFHRAADAVYRLMKAGGKG